MVHEFSMFKLTCDGEDCHAPLSSGSFHTFEDMRHFAYARGWHSRKDHYNRYGFDFYCPECSKKLGLDV